MLVTFTMIEDLYEGDIRPKQLTTGPITKDKIYSKAVVHVAVRPSVLITVKC